VDDLVAMLKSNLPNVVIHHTQYSGLQAGTHTTVCVAVKFTLQNCISCKLFEECNVHIMDKLKMN